MRQFSIALLFALLASPALADPTMDRYKAFVLLDRLADDCGWLTYVEREALRTLTDDALRGTELAYFIANGQAPRTALARAIETGATEAEERRLALGCDGGAELFLANRDTLTMRIVEAIAIMEARVALPADDDQYLALDNDQLAAITAWRDEEKRRLGERWEPLVARALEEASADIERALRLDNALVSGELARRFVNLLVLEQAAGNGGWGMRPVWHNEWRYAELEWQGAAFLPPRTLWTIPDRYVVEDSDAPITAVLAETADGLMVLPYGENALALTEGSTVLLLIRTSPLPEGTDGYTFFGDPDWRQSATAFAGIPGERCLTAQCFVFPPEAREAARGLDEDEEVELFLAIGPGVVPPPTAYRHERNADMVVGLRPLLGQPD